MRRFARLVSVLLLAVAACDAPAPEPDGPLDLRVRLDPPENGYQLRSTPRLVPAYSEVYSCEVVRLEPHADEYIVWLDTFESKSSEYTHHMNVNAGIFSVGDAIFGPGFSEKLLGFPVGQYDCKEMGNLMEKGLQTVYPSQKPHQTGAFPKGVAVPAIVPLVLLMEHHYINTTSKDVLIDAAVNLHTVPEEQVKHVATGFFGGSDVTLAPESRKIIANTCQISRDVNLMAISTHSHERGACFSLNRYDGETQTIDPEPFFVNKDWESPPILFPEHKEWTGYSTIPYKAGDGIHWACHYRNPEDRIVTTGEKAEDEMCIFVALGYPSPLSVADVKNMILNPGGDAMEKLEQAIIPCDPVTDAVSPWPEVNIDLPLSEAPPEECEGYETTSE